MDFKMFGIQTNFDILQPECFMQIMYLQFTLKFHYKNNSQCDVILIFCFFELYYINIIALIIRVIRLRLSNAICGSNFSEKKCMRLKNNYFQHLVGIKHILVYIILNNLEWFLQFHGHIKPVLCSSRSY